MGFGHSLLDKKTGKELLQFDSRISHMLPVVSGKAYFTAENYNPHSGEFGAYIEWDSEINDRLNDRLPSEGYFVKATTAQAFEMCDLPDGLPVYMKLISSGGRLYPYRTYIMINGRPFSVEFNGSPLVYIEDISAANVEAPRGEIRGSRRGLLIGSQGRLLFGSQRSLKLGSQRFLLSGSQRRLLFGGSQRRLLLGSQRSLFGSNRGLYGYNFGSGWRYLYSGSQSFLFGSNRGIYSFGLGGSQRRFLFGGSQKNWTHEWEWEYGTGSQRGLFGSNRGLYALSGSRRSLIAGSNRGLYALGGSQRYLFGSQRYLVGSQRYLLGGSARPLPYFDNAISCDLESDFTDIPYWRYVPKEWQLINESRRPGKDKGGNGKLGYGLDLI